MTNSFESLRDFCESSFRDEEVSQRILEDSEDEIGKMNAMQFCLHSGFPERMILYGNIVANIMYQERFLREIQRLAPLQRELTISCVKEIARYGLMGALRNMTHIAPEIHNERRLLFQVPRSMFGVVLEWKKEQKLKGKKGVNEVCFLFLSERRF
jgi:hypothetical protein